MLIFKSKSIIADCLEAWIGCIFMDEGDVENIILSLWSKYLEQNFVKSPKNELQEISQEKKIQPIYTYEKVLDKFKSEVIIGNEKCSGNGNSKKEASENAARNMLQILERKRVKIFNEQTSYFS